MDELDKKRWMAVAAVFAWFAQALYVVFPIDLLPDFIPVIGWIDDLVALVGLAATTLWMVRTVREAGFRQLFAAERDVLEAEPYEPIPADVIRSL
ncbi:MAG: YkvA family protein [Myxococcota bacterium]